MTNDPGRDDRPIPQLFDVGAGGVLHSAARAVASLFAGHAADHHYGEPPTRGPVVPASVILYVQPDAPARRAATTRRSRSA